jgi:tetratricopeptide (TPR) repeat protein
MPVSAAPIRPDDFAGMQSSNGIRLTASLALVLIVLTACAFLPALHNGFVNFDDGEYVVGNSHVTAGLTWEGVRWAFSTTTAGNWHPITWLSHMLDCYLFEVNPWGHHLTNLVLHTANALLVFFVFSRMAGSIWRSFFMAALFAVHPLRVESVAWASERKDVLSAFFGLLAIGAYARYVKESKVQSPRSKLSYALSLVSFALGLMSKPSVVTLPFVLVLLDYWPLKRSESFGARRFETEETKAALWGKGNHAEVREPSRVWTLLRPGTGALRGLALEKVPYFLLAAGSSVVTFIAQRHEGAVAAMSHVSLAIRLENAAVSYLRYLGKMFWPVDLSVYYALPAHWPAGVVAVSVLFLAAVSLGVIAARKCCRFLMVGWLWFLGTLVPMIGLVQVGEQAMADRYTYIPGLGVLIMLVWSVAELTSRMLLRVASGATSVAIVVLCAVTRQQVGYWKDSASLFRHALAVSPDNYGARINLGNALFSKGRLDDAITEFQQAVRLRPELRLPHSQLAAALRAKGRVNEAIEQFQEILNLNPNDAAAHNELGAMLFDQGRAEDAIAHYREAARLDPGAAATHYNWGIASFFEGRFDEAVAQLNEAVTLQPGNARARYNLGLALLRIGHTKEAIQQLRAALSIEPSAPKAHYQLGLALVKMGRADEAATEFRAALALQPNYPEAAQELAKLTAPK